VAGELDLNDLLDPTQDARLDETARNASLVRDYSWDVTGSREASDTVGSTG
jgi:hypothetical protein